MTNRCRLALIVPLLAGLFLGHGLVGNGSLRADDSKPDEASPDGAKSDDGAAKSTDTAKVKRGPFRIEVDLKGTLQPERVATIRVEPEEWTTLKVVELADQGAAVEKGDVVVAFDTDDLDSQIRQLEFSQRLAELTYEQSVRELAILEKTAPLDLELAERTREQAVEELGYFEEIDKDQQIEASLRSVRNAQFQLEYAGEELAQLKKMYEADDLTEETEEMILKRTERGVESAEYFLERSKLRSKRLLETELPRREKAVKDAAVRAELSLRRAKATMPLAVDKKTIELAKAKHDLDRSGEKLVKLKADRERLVVRAPVSGVVYHGEWKDGTWTLSATLKAQLVVGGTLPAKKPVMTIVRPQPLSIRTTVEEKHVALLEIGTEGKATPTAFPDTPLDCSVTSVAPYPVAPGKFGVQLDVDAGAIERLVPGMTCAVKLTVHERENALTVPSQAVVEEGGRSIVYVSDDGDWVPQTVRVGRTHGGRTEILNGLEAGEQVRTKKP